jgi:hypothetical protein
MLRTPMGLALAPRRDGKVLTPELFEALPEADRERIQRDLEAMQGELEAVMRKYRNRNASIGRLSASSIATRLVRRLR